MKSGFVTLVGRPNVGKSTLVNQLVGQKVAIVSDRPQTTRAAIRGVRTTDESQIVFLDTPGLHRPRTLLGERTNERARATLDEVDVVCVVVEANAKYGPRNPPGTLRPPARTTRSRGRVGISWVNAIVHAKSGGTTR